MISKLSILQVNAQNSSAVAAELSMIVDKFDIILLQEPYIGGILGMASDSKRLAMPTCVKPYVATFCSSGLAPLAMQDLSSDHILVLSVRHDDLDIYFINVYCQFHLELETFLVSLQRVIDALKHKPLIVAMDSNAHSSLWFDRQRDARGALLEDFIFANRLNIINREGESFTFSTVNGESNIDLTLCNNFAMRYLNNWCVDENLLTSDHRAITYNWSAGNDIAECDSSLVRFALERADWELFYCMVLELNDEILSDTTSGAESLCNALQRRLLEISSCSIPIKPVKSRRSCRWWNENISKLKVEVKTARRRFQSARRSGSADANLLAIRLSEARGIYFNAIKEAKRSHWHNFVQTEGNRDPWGLVYKLTMGKLPVSEVLSSISSGASASRTQEESLLLLLESLFPPSAVTDREMLDPDNEYDAVNTDYFTSKELEEAIDQLKPNKSPGVEGLVNEIIADAATLAPEMFLKVFNACLAKGVFPRVWKQALITFLVKSGDRDKKDPKSYRPISLLPALGKLFERLIFIKIKSLKQGQRLYHPQQFGFVKGGGTEAAVSDLLNFVSSSQRRYVAAIMIDIQGAFDSLSWPVLLSVLRSQACPKNLYEVIRDYFSSRSVLVFSAGRRTERDLSCGCPQGSILGPHFWNVVYDRVISSIVNDADTHVGAYADDLVIAVSADSRKLLEAGLQGCLDSVIFAAREVGLTVSSSKTVAILLKGKLDLHRPPTVRLAGGGLRWKAEVRYLGVVLSGGLSFLPHACEQRNKLISISGKLMRVCRRKWGLNRRTLSVLYKSLFIPILTYCSSCWYSSAQGSHIKRVLLSAQRGFLLLITGACRTVSNDALQVLAGYLPADLLLVKRGLYTIINKGSGVEWQDLSFDPDVRVREREFFARCRQKHLEVLSYLFALWQERWVESSRGRCLYSFAGDVRFFIDTAFIKLDYRLSAFLTGHGFFRHNLYRLSLADSPHCVCGEDQTSTHLLLSCRATGDIRNRILGAAVINQPSWFLQDELNFAKLLELIDAIFKLKSDGLLN